MLMFFKVSLVALLALCSSCNGIYLECIYDYLLIENIGIVYACPATIHPSAGEQNVTDVTHLHLDGKNNSDVEALIINDNIAFTPFNIHAFFPNLVSITLYNKTTSELTPASLKGLRSLRQFIFGFNEIQIIESNLFAENPDIEFIYFEGNPLRHVAFNVFDNLQKLTTLNMTETTCVDELATNLDDLDIVKFHVLVKCPPTFEMLEDKIVNGSLLENIVSALIDSKVDPIRDALNEIEEEQRLLIERVDDLERDVRGH